MALKGTNQEVGRPFNRGVPPTTLMINPDGGHAIGIQITPLAISSALVNLEGQMLDMATTAHAGVRHD